MKKKPFKDFVPLPEEIEAVRQLQAEIEKSKNLMDFLEIPHSGSIIETRELMNFLLDPKKFKKLSTKLNNKAFW